jgi:hypothetical protein
MSGDMNIGDTINSKTKPGAGRSGIKAVQTSPIGALRRAIRETAAILSLYTKHWIIIGTASAIENQNIFMLRA